MKYLERLLLVKLKNVFNLMGKLHVCKQKKIKQAFLNYHFIAIVTYGLIYLHGLTVT